MSLELHRQKQDLGGLVYLLTLDMRNITGDPTHVIRFVNSYGDNGQGVQYQGNTYLPHPYQIQNVQRSAKSNKSGSKVLLSDNQNFTLSRFIDRVGGDLQNARVTELKVYGVFLDNQPSANPLAYVKRLDHLVNYAEDSDRQGEVVLNTIDPLSIDIQVPTLSFTAGTPNSDESAINIFPAVDRRVSQKRT